MSRPRLEMPSLTEQNKKRLIEIKFYLFINSFKNILTDSEKQNYFQTLCELTGTNRTMFDYAISYYDRVINRPTVYEKAVALRYFDASLVDIRKHYMHPDTYYRHLWEYRDKCAHGETGLLNKMEPEIYKQIENFIVNYSKIMSKQAVCFRNI